MSVNRLNEPFGILLDRAEQRTFRFDGRTVIGFGGDTLASALAANDIWCHGRSAKSGRPRGLYSQAQECAPSAIDLVDDLGVDPESRLVQDGLQASRLQSHKACRNWVGDIRRAWSKLTVRGQHQSESPKNWMLPRQHGFSEFIAAQPSERRRSLRTQTTDFAVIGGGPAGVAAAIEAARYGRNVTLIDSFPVLGGSLNFERLDVAGDLAEKYATDLAEEMSGVEANITVLLNAHCREISSDRCLKVETGNSEVKISAEQIILATGASQRFGVFANNDLPGIMSGTNAAKLIWLYGIRPGRKAVVVVDSGQGFGLALDLLDAGVEVQAVLDPQCRVQSDPRRDAVVGRGVEIGYGYGVRAAHASDGGRHLGAVTIEYLNRADKAQTKPIDLECDLLCIAAGSVPNLELAINAGARLSYSPTDAALSLFDIPDGVGLAGALGGWGDIDQAIESGRELAREGTSGSASVTQVRLEPNNVSPEALVSEFAFVDFASEVTVNQVYTGLSKGRPTVLGLCRDLGLGNSDTLADQAILNVYDFMADHTPMVAEAPHPEIYFQTQSNSMELSVAAAGAERRLRRSPAEAAQLAQGAEMALENFYWAAQRYRTNGADATAEEVIAVREKAGFFDYSGWGKLHLHGPDLERMTAQLGLPCSPNTEESSARGNESGVEQRVLIDAHGVVLSIIELIDLDEGDALLLTPFSTLPVVRQSVIDVADRFDLAVGIDDCTDDLALFGLAGPNADLAAENLALSALTEVSGPLPDVSSGDITVTATDRLGEPGYLLSMSQAVAERVWAHFATADEELGLKPIGQSALNTLRLEKGTLCPYRDVDAFTNIAEIASIAGVSEKILIEGELSKKGLWHWRGLE
ncbi:MAG TPA: hypothetical protein DCS82_13665, partial [Rhodospirillaceae bacterium]|nr:hypothetical protein [Rhodospirillaceae bacterium]